MADDEYFAPGSRFRERATGRVAVAVEAGPDSPWLAWEDDPAGGRWYCAAHELLPVGGRWERLP